MSDVFYLPMEIESKREAASPSESPKEVKQPRFYHTLSLPQEQGHATLKNESNVCYLNVIVFNLFYLEPFRKFIMNKMIVGGSRLLKLLKDIFAKMATQRYACDVGKMVHYLSDHAALTVNDGGDPVAVYASLTIDLLGLRRAFKGLLPTFIVVELETFFHSRMYDPAGEYDGRGTNLEYYDRSLSLVDMRARHAMYGGKNASNVLFFVLQRADTNAQKTSTTAFAETIHLNKFTFPLKMEMYGLWYELYSVFIHDFRWKGVDGHALTLIRGHWGDVIDPTWRLFSDSEVGDISQTTMEQMSFGGCEHLSVDNLTVANGITYVETTLYDTFHWNLNDIAFH